MADRRRGLRTGAKALLESIERAGVEVVFGYPGNNVLDIFEHIPKARFRFVLGRHEQGSTHMADGYARATGRPGVVIVTSGPGATNAITGLATANVDGVPMVLISGQVPLSQIGTDAFQEADMTGICRGATKHSFLVKSADEIPETVAEAFYIATHGKPGAVVIDLPKNVQEELTSAQYPERISLRAYHPECAATTTQVNRLARLINEAKRPVILAGGGVIASNAAADVAALAKKAGIPVATTLMGIGSFDENEPLSLGMVGLYGTPQANAAIDAADLILALGVRFNDRVTGPRAARFGRRAKIVHVDCDPSSIDKNVQVSLGIVADIKDLLTTVASRVKREVKVKGEGEERNTTVHLTSSPSPELQSPTFNLQPLPDDAIIVTDVGENQMWCARQLTHSRPRHFISSGGMGTMGFAIPAAIGAAIARPDRKVIAIMGDGGAQMTSEELIVAVQEKLPIVFVVLNNRCLGMVREMPISSPDFVRLAAAYGLSGVRVDAAGAEKAIARALRKRRPTLVEVMI